MISARTKKVWLHINQAIMQRAFHWEDVIAELTEQLYLDLERKMNSANVPSLSLDVIILIKWYHETCGKNRLIFRKEVLYYFRSLYRLSNDFNVNEEFTWLEGFYEKRYYIQ